VDSPASLATCILGFLEDEAPSVFAYLGTLAAADLPVAAASKVKDMVNGINGLLDAAAELIEAVENPAA